MIFHSEETEHYIGKYFICQFWIPQTSFHCLMHFNTISKLEIGVGEEMISLILGENNKNSPRFNIFETNSTIPTKVPCSVFTHFSVLYLVHLHIR